MVKKKIILTFILTILLVLTLCPLYSESMTFSSDVFWQLRFPRIMTAFLAGGAVALSGLLMQSYFQNPLAGPYVLGIHSGATFFVALWFMFFNQMTGQIARLGPIGSALIGSFLMMSVIISISKKVGNKILLVLLGLFVSQLASGLLTVCLNFAQQDHIKAILLWSFGTFQRTALSDLPFLLLASLMPLILAFRMAAHLDLLNLGETYAHLSGMNFKKISLYVIMLTGFSTGLVVAFCGPIAFIGLAAIHLSKMIFKTEQHVVLIPASFMIGAIMALFVEALNLWMAPLSLPLNAVLGILGAPVIILFIYQMNFRQA
ncbi:MAG: iron ABC transporter permease [Bdellovibrio sp.]|nr:iron ABC transporter permease [Bdellovibrio sp.]